MKILWITNSLFPEAQALLTGKKGIIKGSGGWLSASAEALTNKENIHLSVVAINSCVKKLTRLKGERIIYYVIPKGKGNIELNKDYIPYWVEINDDFSPDLIHLHGTEFSHGWSLFKALPNAKIIISIQGLMSKIEHYYTYGMSSKEVCKSITIRDVIHDIVKRKEMCGSLQRRQKNFQIRGMYEKLIVQMSKAVIGRTNWDRANVMAINPNLNYYFCNETLRPEFYSGKWQYDKCEPHTIFLSQAIYPFKGLHMMLKAMPIILRAYPNTKIVVAGSDIIGGEDFKSRIMRTGYSQYILSLMKELNLDRNNVVFTGPLDANEMKQQYLRCNVFVSPSAIENSPNSVCEAQMLGVPIVATYVGGTPDLIPDERCGLLYRFEDYEILASLIIQQFANSKDFNGNYEIELARKRHNKENNVNQLMSIYHTLYSDNSLI